MPCRIISWQEFEFWAVTHSAPAFWRRVWSLYANTVSDFGVGTVGVSTLLVGFPTSRHIASRGVSWFGVLSRRHGLWQSWIMIWIDCSMCRGRNLNAIGVITETQMLISVWFRLWWRTFYVSLFILRTPSLGREIQNSKHPCDYEKQTITQIISLMYS